MKELKSSASIQDQIKFLEEVQPYRSVHQTSAFQWTNGSSHYECTVKLLFIYSCYMSLLWQYPSAPCPPAVSGTVFRGHPISTGHGVLPSGMTTSFVSSNYLFCSHIDPQSEQLQPSFLSSCQGDMKNYLRSCQSADSETPDILILQKMACDVASGLLHLHKYNIIHRFVAQIAVLLYLHSNSDVNVFKRKLPPKWSCAPPYGLFLQQNPGAARVVDTNSSISDFVAGGEPLSLSVSLPCGGD